MISIQWAKFERKSIVSFISAELDIVPRFSEDVTRAMRGQPKRLSRNHARKIPPLGQESNGPKLRVVLTRVLSRHEVMIATDIGKFFLVRLCVDKQANKERS